MNLRLNKASLWSLGKNEQRENERNKQNNVKTDAKIQIVSLNPTANLVLQDSNADKIGNEYQTPVVTIRWEACLQIWALLFLNTLAKPSVLLEVVQTSFLPGCQKSWNEDGNLNHTGYPQWVF